MVYSITSKIRTKSIVYSIVLKIRPNPFSIVLGWKLGQIANSSIALGRNIGQSTVYSIRMNVRPKSSL